MTEKTETEAMAEYLKEPYFVNENQLVDGKNCVFYLPPGWTKGDLAEYLDKPLRIKQQTVVHDVVSFHQYAVEFWNDEIEQPVVPRLFGDESQKQIVAVLDPTMPDKPSHQSHTLTLKMEYSPEWLLWRKIAGRYCTRTEFTRFIENNLEFIVGDFSGAKILEMCRDLKATNTSELNINEDLEHGTRRLTFNSSQRVAASKPGSDVQVTFPEIIKIELRVFKGYTKFDFQARLRWDFQDNNLMFAIDLRDSEVVEENAFCQVVQEVIDTTSLPVLRGSYK